MLGQAPAASYVLAGGRSRRFGSDKALHLVDGEPLVCRVARALATAGAPVFLVSRHPRGLGLDEVIEPDGPRHPLWGVATALRRRDGVGLFAPCDLPSLGPAHVQRLLAAGAPAYATSQPCLCLLPAHVADAAERAAREGRPVRAFLAEVDAAPVDVGPLANLNRPAPAGGG